MAVPTRDKLIQSAIEIAATKGIEGATTTNISKNAGCSEGMIYKCFHDKYELLNEAFLLVDRAISDIAVRNRILLKADGSNIMDIAEATWKLIYHYLLEHPTETTFLIRFRYSSLYNDEIRKKRVVYNGSFDEINNYVDRVIGTHAYTGFIVNMIFEVTLASVVKILTGRLENTEAVEEKIWKMIVASLRSLLEEE